MTINVLGTDFRRGERCAASSCPIARACLRAAQPLGYEGVSVTREDIKFWFALGSDFTLRKMPPAVAAIVERFDAVDFKAERRKRYKPVHARRSFPPFQFEIKDLPRVR